MMKQRGNILFLILLAVVLFAALSYAVTSSMRGGGNNAENETASLEAAGMIGYGNEISTAIMRMKLINNCNDTQISFQSANWSSEVPSYSSHYENSNSPINNSCHVFEQNGGGVGWINPSKTFKNSIHSAHFIYGIVFTGGNPVKGLGCDAYNPSNTSDCSDLIVMIRTNEQVCRVINEKLAVIEKNSALPIDDGSLIEGRFTGTYSHTNNFIWDTDNLLYGRQTACFYTAAFGGGYYFYHVLIER